jgi:hypothetical protein
MANSVVTAFDTTRVFKLWEYQVSHGHLLVRSPIAPASGQRAETPTNIDLLFMGVVFVDLPVFFDGLSLAEPSDEDRQRVQTRLGRSVSENIFRPHIRGTSPSCRRS